MPSRRVRLQVNPLRSDYFTIAPSRIAVSPQRPLEVELGSAEAVFIMERAAAAPERDFVGVEIRDAIVEKANREAGARGLGNVRSVYANMSVDLPRLFAAGSVSRFFLNFPDPWWKSKQHKRRVAEPTLIEHITTALADDGEVYVNTDIFEIALEAMFLLEQAPAFGNLAGAWSFLKQPLFAARSRREMQCLVEGATIWRLGYRKQRVS